MHFTLELHAPELARRLDEIEAALTQLGTTIMSVISDYAAKQEAFNTQIATDLSAVAAQITALNATITQLQNSVGTVTPEDQALIDKLQTDGAALQSQADTLAGTTPPVVPAAAKNA